GGVSPGTVSQYDVGPGGRLSPKAPPTVAAHDGPAAIAISPDGKNVYVANGGRDFVGDSDDLVSQYDVGPGGRLSPKDPPTVAAGYDPLGIAMSPDGRSVYVANSGFFFGIPSRST